MLLELARAGLQTKHQVPIVVHYRGETVGEYFADILVDNLVILELKAAETVAEEHEAQLINYLRATEVEIGLLLNFGKKPEVRTKIFTNDRKSAGRDGPL